MNKSMLSYCEKLINEPLVTSEAGKKLFEQSVTHESYDANNSYERQEFLGDSILGCVVAKYLFRRFEKQNESFLTEMKIKIVNSNMLSWLCRCIKLNIYIKITDSINPNKIYEDVFEAFIGAFYINFGFLKTEKFIVSILENPNFIDFTDLIMNDYNYKKKLMILLQKKLDGRLPVFHNLPLQLAIPNYPDSENLFHTVVCHPNGKILGIGVSKTIKLAQQSACKMALENIDKDYESEYQKLLERKKFEKVLDLEINDKNLLIDAEIIKQVWNRYLVTPRVKECETLDLTNYQSAFIHKTYFLINDPRYREFSSNERLNFLGNSLLMYFITDFLFQKYPNENEGFLTKIKTGEIQNRNLFQYCTLLDLNKFLVLTKNDEFNRYNQSHSEQLFCSFIASMYLDQGLERTKEWLFEMWKKESKMINVSDENFKHQLLLKIQENPIYKFYKYPFPTYKILGAETNFEKKTFTVQVFDPNGKIIGKGTGKTKKDAEQNASKHALSALSPDSTSDCPHHSCSHDDHVADDSGKFGSAHFELNCFEED